MATLIELAARTVADAVREARVGYLAASGGGCRNPLLMRRLRELLPEVEVVLTDELRLPADTKEAVLMALIGWWASMIDKMEPGRPAGEETNHGY